MTLKTTIITIYEADKEPDETTLAFYRFAEVGIKQGFSKSALLAFLNAIQDEIASDAYYDEETFQKFFYHCPNRFMLLSFDSEKERTKVAQLVVGELYHSWYGSEERKEDTSKLLMEVFN